MFRGFSWLVLMSLLLSGFASMGSGGDGSSCQVAQDTDSRAEGQQLLVARTYIVTGDEVWGDVLVWTNGRLRVPAGAALRTGGLALMEGSTLELTGGTVEVYSSVPRSDVKLNGTCDYLNVTDGSTIRVLGSTGSAYASTSRGSNAVVDVVATVGARIEHSFITACGGDGFCPAQPWTDLDLDGYVSAGGYAMVRLNLSSKVAPLVVDSSIVEAFGGNGSDAPDGKAASGNWGGKGGGFTNGGNVSGCVGMGGSAKVELVADRLEVNGSRLAAMGGRGGRAGYSEFMQYGAQAGSGGGGYSGGDGYPGLQVGTADSGGAVSGYVGAGGPSIVNVTARTATMEGSSLRAVGGRGGDAGSGGRNGAIGGAGGGGYSGGGGGSYYGGGAGDGGPVSGHVGAGGEGRTRLSSSVLLTLRDLDMTVAGGDGGVAGNGGNTGRNGGAGGGGYSGGGGGGEGSLTGNHPGNDGGNGGDISGDVGRGGLANITIEAARVLAEDMTMSMKGGSGGSAGKAGTNAAGDGGWGGGGYSAGGGAGIGHSGQPNGTAGRSGTVSAHVGDGGDTQLWVEGDYVTICRSVFMTSIPGIGGAGADSNAPAPLGGEGLGRATENGTAFKRVPMNRPLPLSPPDGRHVASVPTLAWTDVWDSTTNGPLVGYTVEVDDDPEFASPAVSTRIEPSSYFPSGLPDGAYHWRVSSRYFSPQGIESGWSFQFYLIIGINRPPAVENPLGRVIVLEDTVDAVVGNVHEIFIEPDGDAITYSSMGTPNVSIAISPSGDLLVTPAHDFSGNETVSISAKEANLDDPLEIEHTFVVEVVNVNDVPSIDAASPLQQLLEDVPFVLDLNATDPDPGDALTWTIDGNASFISIDATTGLLSGTPTNNDVGDHWAEVTVTDAAGTGDMAGFVLSVQNVNDPPEILTNDVTVCEPDDIYAVQYVAMDIDPDHDALVWGLETNATFLSIQQLTGLLTGPRLGKPSGIYWVNVSVMDGHGACGFNNFTLTVMAIDDPPVVDNIPLEEVTEDVLTTIDLTPYIGDVDTPVSGLSLSCEAMGVQSVRGLSMALLFTSWTADHEIRFNVSDGTSTVQGCLMVSIRAVNDAPMLWGIGGLSPPYKIEVREGESIWLPICATDEEDPRLDFTIDSGWHGIEVSPYGTVHVLAGQGDVGNWSATLLVSDDEGQSVLAVLSVRVLNVNDPPRLLESSQPINHTVVTEGTAIYFEVTVTDPDLPYGDALTTRWTSNVSGELGVLSGIGRVGFNKTGLPPGVHRITVTVSDGELEDSGWFELTVVERTAQAEPRPFYRTPQAIGVIVIVAVAACVLIAVIARVRGRPGRGSR